MARDREKVCCEIRVISVETNAEVCIEFELVSRAEACVTKFGKLAGKKSRSFKYDKGTGRGTFCFRTEGGGGTRERWLEFILRARENGWTLAMCTDGESVLGFRIIF